MARSAGRSRHARNGRYFAWFRTPQGEGAGIVVLSDGKLSGGDTVSDYTGAYVLEGNKITASVAARRRTQGRSVFGIDDVDLTVTGKSTPTMASCAGTAKQQAGAPSEVDPGFRSGPPPECAPPAGPRHALPSCIGVNIAGCRHA
jgi:hypothetical protein